MGTLGEHHYAPKYSRCLGALAAFVNGPAVVIGWRVVGESYRLLADGARVGKL
jgi:hypothetical protein